MLKARRVLQYTLDGQFVAEHDSITAAAKAVNTSAGNIHNCCVGRYIKKTCGFVFKFEEDVRKPIEEVSKVINQKYENEVMGGK